MVVPKESAWFGSEAVGDENEIQMNLRNDYEHSGQSEQIQLDVTHVLSKTIIPMRLQPLYTEDWIGLRQLDERGSVVLETCEGEHMQLGDCWERLIKRFAGGIPTFLYH
jgi:palmitoyl-protein thioesterase